MAISALNPDSVATGLRVNGIDPDSGVHVNAAYEIALCLKRNSMIMFLILYLHTLYM